MPPVWGGKHLRRTVLCRVGAQPSATAVAVIRGTPSPISALIFVLTNGINSSQSPPTIASSVL